MNILYVASESADLVLNLCQEIAKQGHTITVVVQELDVYDQNVLKNIGSNIRKIEVDYNTIFEPGLLKKHLEEKGVFNDDYDIMFGSNTPIAPVLNYFHSILNIPWGIMLHDVPLDLISQDDLRALKWKFWLKDLKSASQICFNTYTARDAYITLSDIYFSDDNVFTYATKVPEKDIMSGSVVKGDYVLSISRIVPHKNFGMITRALAYLNKPIKQVIVGRGDENEVSSIFKIAKENNVKIVFAGMVSDEEKSRLIKEAMCLIYPQKSAYLGGLSPWESMMIGTPTICSDYKILRDLYKNHVEYFDVNSVYSLGSKIIEAYNNDYNIPKLQFASDYACEEASFSTMATKLLKIMSNIKGD